MLGWGVGGESQPGGEVTPELGFEGWIEFHQADWGANVSGSGSNMAKKQKVDGLGLAFREAGDGRVRD